MATIGIRQNNPLNIRYSEANQWQGRLHKPSPTDFEWFKSMAFGYRAAAVLITAHVEGRSSTSKAYGKPCNTIGALIHIWAPPKENNTGRYANFVARQCGVGPDEPVNILDYEMLVKILSAMTIVENGKSSDVTKAMGSIGDGLKLAGYLPPKKNMITDAGIAAPIAAGTAGASGWLSQLTDLPIDTHSVTSTAVQFLKSDGLAYAVIAILVAIVGYMLYERIKHRNTFSEENSGPEEVTDIFPDTTDVLK